MVECEEEHFAECVVAKAQDGAIELVRVVEDPLISAIQRANMSRVELLIVQQRASFVLEDELLSLNLQGVGNVAFVSVHQKTLPRPMTY